MKIIITILFIIGIVMLSKRKSPSNQAPNEAEADSKEVSWQRNRSRKSNHSSGSSADFPSYKILKTPILLPETCIDTDEQIREIVDGDITYKVDIIARTCTCVDFQKTRAKFAKQDIRRICQHLQRALKRLGALEEAEDYILELLNYGAKKNCLTVVPSKGMTFYISYDDSTPWIDVVSRKRKKGEKGILLTGGYERFGFNRIENRWSYGDGPPGASFVKHVLHEKVF